MWSASPHGGLQLNHTNPLHSPKTPMETVGSREITKVGKVKAALQLYKKNRAFESRTFNRSRKLYSLRNNIGWTLDKCNQLFNEFYIKFKTTDAGFGPRSQNQEFRVSRVDAGFLYKDGQLATTDRQFSQSDTSRPPNPGCWLEDTAS